MILKDVEPFEAYDCKTGGCGYEGESFDAYVNGMQRVLEDLDSQPEIDLESLPVVKQLRAELEKVKAERDAAVEAVRLFVYRKRDACDYCKRNDPSNYTCTKNHSGYCASWEYGVFNKWH